MNFGTKLDSPNFKSLPSKYKIQLELKDFVINKLQKQLKDMTEELLATKTTLNLIKDQFLNLLKKIINNPKKYPKDLYKGMDISKYISNLSQMDKSINKSELNESNLNKSYSTYIDNNSKSFAFSSRYNTMMEEYLIGLSKRGKYKENSNWIKENNSLITVNIKNKPKIEIENNSLFKRDVNKSEMRLLSEKNRKKNINTKYINRSLSSKSLNKGKTTNNNISQHKTYKNINVNSNINEADKILRYCSPYLYKK